MSEGGTDALLVTPLPPMQTGLATYALRVIENTMDFINWTVAYPSGSSPEALPDGVKSLPIEDLDECCLPAARIFQIGNSPHCFPVVQALYRFGGTALLHETVVHHMLRHCYLESNRIEEYRKELSFCYGPASAAVEKDISTPNIPVDEFDRKLKQYPLIGRILHYSNAVVCLNPFAGSLLKNSFPDGGVLSIGHPLSMLPKYEIPKKPYRMCFGMVGGNHPGRNLDSLIEAIDLLRSDIPDSGLILIGSGYPDKLPDWVTAAGRLPEPEYQGWIRTLDYVFDVRYPTCGETSGSLLEAMRAGIPSIVTATGSFNNIPSDAVIRIPHDSIVQGIRSAVLLLESRSDIKRSISEKAKSFALDTGSLERLSGDWKRVLRLALKPPADDFNTVNIKTLSPAWQDPPAGFTRDISTSCVTWKFSGSALLEAPPHSSGALVTAWGEGSIEDIDLPREPAVLRIDGNVLRFKGNGWVSNVFWK